MRPDEIIDALAASQHGVVSRAQLLAAGLNRQTIDRRVASGRLEPLHTGVYLLRGHTRSVQARAAAACLAAGPGAAASHRCAAQLLGIDVGPAPVEITVCGKSLPRLRAVVVHRASDLDPVDIDVCRGVPVTRVARTLIDLAAVLADDPLEEALDEAPFCRLVTLEQVVTRLNALGRQGRKGAGRLAHLLDERAGGGDRPLTIFERRLFRVLRRARLPLPTPQFEVVLPDGAQRFLDFAYPDLFLAIEADSWKCHSRMSDWAADHVRNREIVALGWRIMPATWGDLGRPRSFLAALSRGLCTVPRAAG